MKTGIQNGGLYVETQAGEINPQNGYDTNWLAWATPHKPDRTKDTQKEEEIHEGGEEEEKQEDDDIVLVKPKFIETDFTRQG